MPIRKQTVFGLLAACVLSASGCALFPEWAQPEQLWKLNRHPPLDTGDGYFSVPAEPRLGETRHRAVRKA